MSARYALDTDTCIHALNGRQPGVVAKIDRMRAGRIVVCPIVIGELRCGIARSSRAADASLRLDALLSVIRPVGLDDAVAGHYGSIRADLEAEGRTIGNNDLWIAAHARSAGLILVTHNTREFARVRGLKLEDWIAC
jgi:tRNA(fMet)-specific endonuclease VapC